MIIQRLVITSFGGEYNRVVDFSEDVNLIMASNSNTLDTIRAFINGMLFGLTKEEQKKYHPDRLPFSGSMFIEDNDKSLKINRNFLNGEFEVLDADGNNITEEYSDEYGELSLLPIADSVYPEQQINIPEANNKDKETLERLYHEREKLQKFYDYDALVEKRDKLVTKLEGQKEIKSRLQSNIKLITTNEEREKELKILRENQLLEIDHKISDLEKKKNSINIEIDKLKEKESNGKTQILQRNIQGNDEQLKIVKRRLAELNSEEVAYQDKLDHLKASFTIDRNELNKDHDAFIEEDETDKESIYRPDPFVERLSSIDTWFYTVLIILGGIGITFALTNPQEFLTQVPIFAISFVSVFIILFSILIIYIRIHTGLPVPIAEALEPERKTVAQQITSKYNLKSSDEFLRFYDNASKVYTRIDDLEADLKDIREEIKESKEEQEKLIEANKKAEEDLSKKVSLPDETELREQILEQTKEINKIDAQIEELNEEKENINAETGWKLQNNNELEEANAQLENHTSETDALLKEFDEINTTIERYETNLMNLDDQIAKTEKKVYNEKREYVNSYANPETDDYKFNVARQFGFGLQNNIKANVTVPYIVLNPLKNAGEINEVLIEKFNNFLNDHQAIVFSTTFDEQEVFKNSNLRHNGIFLLDSKF